MKEKQKQVVNATLKGELVVKEVNFLGDNLLTAKDETENKIYVSARYICNGLGLTRDQAKNERKRIQDDIVLSKGGRNLTLPTSGGNQDVLCIDIDYLPLWLAKISVTPKMKEQQQESVEKLVEYQLKAKDVLANAFVHQQSNIPSSVYSNLSPELQAIFVIDAKQQQQELRLNRLENDMPLFNVECKELQLAVRKKGVEVLGGCKSKAYNDKSLRTKVYTDIQKQLRREFGVSRYEAIKRSQFETAKQIVQKYKAPTVLITEIDLLNSQASLFDKNK